MSHNFSDFSNIPPEMRGTPPIQPDMLASNLDAFKQAIQDQLEELNKMLQDISKNIQSDLQKNPGARRSIMREGSEKIHAAISTHLQNIHNDLLDQFPAPRVPPSHIDHFIGELSAQLAQEYDVGKIASSIGADGKNTATPFELFKSSGKPKKGSKKPKMPSPQPLQPPPARGRLGAGAPAAPAGAAAQGPSLGDMNNSVQDMLNKMFGGGSGAPAGGASFNTNFVLGLIQQFLGTNNLQSKQVIFAEIQAAMNQGSPSQGVGSASSAANAAAGGAGNLPSIYGGPSAINFGNTPTTVQMALQYAIQWESMEKPGSPAYDLAKAVKNAIQTSANSNQTFAQMQAAVSKLFSGNQDVYFQYPGVTQHEAENLYFITQLGTPPGTPPAPTAIDITLFNLNYLESQQAANSPDATLYANLINAVQGLPNGSQSTSQDVIASKFFDQTFLNKANKPGWVDAYMNGVSGASIGEIFKLLNAGPAPKPTVIDEYYLMALQTQSSWNNPNYPQNNQLCTNLINLLRSFGSISTPAQLTALQNAGKNLRYSLPSTDPNLQYTVSALTGNTDSAMPGNLSYLQGYINWMTGGNPSFPPPPVGSALFNLAQNLSNYLGANINLSITNSIQYNQNITYQFAGGNTDLFMQYPGVAAADLQKVFNLISFNITFTPTLADQAALQIYNYMQGVPLGSADYEIALNFLNQLQSAGSMTNVTTPQQLQQALAGLFQTAYTSTVDIYMAHPDVGSDLIALFQNLTGLPIQPTATDAMYIKAWNWMNSTAGVTDDAKLAKSLLSDIYSLGSNGTYSNTWAAAQFQNGLKAFPNLTVQGIIQFCQIAQVPFNALDPYRIVVGEWQAKFNPQSPEYLLAGAFLNEIANLGTSGTSDALEAWFNSVLKDGPGNLDVYEQFPGISQAQIQNLVEFFPGMQVPPPTIIDNIYAQFATIVSINPEDKRFINIFLKELQNLGNMAGSNQAGVNTALQNWFNQTYSFTDPYMQYPGISPGIVGLVCQSMGMAAEQPTAIDNIYLQAYQYAQTPNLPAIDQKLMNDLMQEIDSKNSTPPVGSFGSFINVSYWALPILKSHFANYPGISEATKNEFINLTGLNLNNILGVANDWLQKESMNKNSGAYQLALKLVNEIKGLLPNGTLGDLQNWFNNTFVQNSSGGDVYMQDPGQPPLSQSDLQSFYNICFLKQAPPPTAMDTQFFSVYLYALNLSGNDQKLINDLMNQMRTLGSAGTSQQLNNWANDFIRSSPDYTNASPAIRQAFLKFAKQWA